MIHDAVFIITLVLMTAVVLVFAYVAKNAGAEAVEYGPLQAKAYGIRSKFFWVLIVVGVLTTLITTLDLPYAATHSDVSDVQAQIDISGSQWYWQVGDAELHAGDTVVFNITATDVNHGLGVYDPSMKMIGQAQAMPGYTNSLKLTLSESGTYKLLCMEYCGLAHHSMISEITVLEN